MSDQPRAIWCCACNADVKARRVTGAEVYPHRPDLAELIRWRCDGCGNHVGCHKGGAVPLGCIPTPEIQKARVHIHAILDPLWRNGSWKRGALYAELTKRLGREYHTGDLRSIEEARQVYRWVREIAHA